MPPEIDQKERDIESLCLKLLLQQQPVARDLRQISAALKMITDMERIGDQAEDIAEIVGFLNGRYRRGRAPLSVDMARAAISMVTGSVDAFVRQDVTLAQQVIAEDDVVDELISAQVKADADRLHRRSEPDDGEYALDLLMIAKYFERIGDHATNIAELGGVLRYRRCTKERRTDMIWCVEDDSEHPRDRGVYPEVHRVRGPGLCRRRSLLGSAGDRDAGAGAAGRDAARRGRRVAAAPSAAPPRTRDIPVIMATAKGAEYDKIQGLDMGADDYLVKPFGMMEMVSRVKAVLRRCAPVKQSRQLSSGGVTLDLDGHTVTGGRPAGAR